MRKIRLNLVALCLFACARVCVALTPQALVPNLSPTIQRGGEASVSFTATRSISSIIKQARIAAPPGMLITSVGAGSTGAMPVCRIVEPLPAPAVTCVASNGSDAYFPFAPMHSIKVTLMADSFLEPGIVQGTMQLESRYAGTTSSTYTVSVVDSPLFSDGQAQLPSRQDRHPVVVGVILGLLGSAANIFYGWYQTGLLDQQLNAAKMKAALFYQTAVAKYVGGFRPPVFTEYAPIGGLAALTMDQTTGSFRQQACSATVVPSRGRNLIMTAAHCLFNPTVGAWATLGAFCVGGNEITNDGVLYCPVERRYQIKNLQNGNIVAYLNKIWDQYPSGAVPASDPRFSEYDLAFVELNPNPKTLKNVEDVVGSYGIVFNSNPINVQSATIAGYPGANNYKFLLCQQNNAPNIVSNKVADESGGITGIMTGNVYGIKEACSNMTQGASGGPWLLRSNKTGGEQLIFGVNAQLLQPKVNKWFLWGGSGDTGYTHIFSPTLVGWTQALYETASGMTALAY